MKKFIAIVAAALCACTLFACKDASVGVIGGADGPTAVTVGKITDNESLSFYINQAAALVQKAALPACEEDFVSLYAVRGEMYDTIKTIGGTDFSSPVKVQILTPDRQKTLKLLEESGDTDEFGVLYRLGRFGLMSFATSYNGAFGANKLAACSVLTAENGFAMREDFNDDFAVILSYEGDYSAFVCYSRLGEALRAQATFICNGESGTADISHILDEIGIVYTLEQVK